jgi:uncharacterized membrane protein
MPETNLKSLRNTFLSGLLMLAPIAVTWVVVSWLVESIGGTVRPLLFPDYVMQSALMRFLWNALAMFIAAALITGLGWLSRYVLGQYFASLTDRLLLGIPGINTIYNTVKQLVDTFGPQKRNMFSKVVLLEYPRKGCWTVGFVTNSTRGLPQSKLPGDIWTVFVPTTPNPTSGFMLLLPREELIELEMSVTEGMKMVISGGTVTPPAPAAQAATPL